MITPAGTRRKIVISRHARTRLEQRLPQVDKRQYNQIVNNARYSGKTLSEVSAQCANYIRSITKSNATAIRIYKDAVFVFRGKGKAHQLVTVFPLKEKYAEVSERS